MKKYAALLMAAVVLLFACAGAQAAEKSFGEAVLRVGGSGWAYLRQQPSITSESIGVYYSGTELEMLSDPGQSWVKVRIGRVDGYMNKGYLCTGEEADMVVPSWPVGVIQSEGSINMRSGPSVKYESIGRLANGKEIAILGRTHSDWYYVMADGKTGYVSVWLVEMTDRITGENRAPAAWEAAYRAYLMGQGDIGAGYGLIEVNGDGIPELVIDTGAEAGGCLILTYGAQGVDVLQTARRGFTYIEGKNLLSNSDGAQGMYYDYVYEIREGRWTSVFTGNYCGEFPEWNPAQERYICDLYMIDGGETTMEKYMRAYDAVYNRKKAVGAQAEYGYEEMLAELKK